METVQTTFENSYEARKSAKIEKYLISVYTREDAIRDGYQVNVSEMAEETELTIPGED